MERGGGAPRRGGGGMGGRVSTVFLTREDLSHLLRILFYWSLKGQ
jgi:hypothetical protein